MLNRFFIGGSPCCGKSTLTKLLAERHNLSVYHCDAHYEIHLKQAKIGSVLEQIKNRTWAENFTMRSLKTMIEEELQANFELGQLALEDLSAFKSGFIAGGMAFLPNLMASLEPRNQIVYLIPTTSFQTEHYARREWVNGLLQTTPNPKETFANWMARDATNAQRIAQEAALNNFPVLLVDGSMDIQQTLAWAEKQFQL